MKETEKQVKNTGIEKGITPRGVDYSRWYLDVIAAAELSDNSPVHGCMVIKPNGYAIWEGIQKVLDEKFKKTGVENVYFPLFIPQSFLTREADHVDGFATECAVVTHHRLKKGADGKMIPDPDAKLEEPLIVRPTSETIMYHTFSSWIQSYRDLPLIVNQWANVVRWEMKTRPFLRTTEFLWQEGHTAHATKDEAEKEASLMLGVYRDFAENYLAIPVIPGRKTESEKFAGADFTTTIEAMMQDGKALQAGTSHMLGQNFAKAFEVKFLDADGQQKYVWQTSWGLSTRIIGAVIMAHSDDKGLVLPPKIAPNQVVILPLITSETDGARVVSKTEEISNALSAVGIRVKCDFSKERLGAKSFKWEKNGVPVRIEIGPRDVSNGSVVVVRRDTGFKEIVAEINVVGYIQKLLDSIQSDMYQKALDFRNSNTRCVDTWTEFKSVLEEKGGFLLAHWCGKAECEADIKAETKSTTRCIPFDREQETGKCVFCGNHSDGRIIFAKAY